MSTVKFIHSAMTGAPVLTGQAGSLIALLDACLVNGFGAATVDSLVVAGGVATVTRGAGHPFSVSEIAQIGGATVTGGSVNGDKRVLSVTATTYTFDATGIPNQTATGTVTHKVAQLGWGKAFNGTNLAAYRTPDVTSTRLYLRVDDTGTTDGRVVGYETMTDVNTGTGPFPTAAQISGGGYWTKSNTANSTARPWVVVGDTRGFYLWTNFISTTGVTFAFGDFASRKSPDPWACSLSYATAAALGSASTDDIGYATSGSTPRPQASPRGVSGLGTSQLMQRLAGTHVSGGSGRYSGESNAVFPAYPNPGDNALLLCPVLVMDMSPTAAMRGSLPGVYHCVNSIGSLSVFPPLTSITGVLDLPGRTLRAVNAGSSGPLFFDVTGPWAR